jgi:aspartate aminotransferase
MSRPTLSKHFASRKPSAIRLAQIEFMKRSDECTAVNTAIGNVSLPMHPAMQRRMRALGEEGSPFRQGVVPYSATVGYAETQRAFLNVIASSGLETEGLQAMITDGGSQAMELVVLGVCGPAGSEERPLLLIDAAYTNYNAMAKRLGRKTVSVQRTLGADGCFSLPNMREIETVIEGEGCGALVVIPYDNPTGQLCRQEAMTELAELCVKHDMWMISDEAYRELYYVEAEAPSIWRLDDRRVPGIEGRRMSIETASKVWNACGLRIGALVTDNPTLHEQAVAEYTANLCSNAIGQHIFGSLAHESAEDLHRWYDRQRAYYRAMLTAFTADIHARLPGIIVSSPDASIYSVVDVREIAGPDFDAVDFVTFCAREGRVEIDGKTYTLLVAPMAGFYSVPEGEANPGVTQMRIAYVETPDRMKLVPRLFAELFEKYEARR